MGRVWTRICAAAHATKQPLVVCPGCGEPMDPKGNAPATRELDDISYVCLRCDAETKRTMKRA